MESKGTEIEAFVNSHSKLKKAITSLKIQVPVSFLRPRGIFNLKINKMVS